MIIDTHAHLSLEDENTDSVIKEMEDNIIIVSGTNAFTNKEVIELCNKYNNIYGTLGIHPMEVDEATASDLNFIRNNLNNPKIVGVGEIGIDLYWRGDNLDLQTKWFNLQLDLAKEFNKTAVIHNRKSKEEIYEVLKNHSNLKVIFHCYDGDYDYYLKIKEIVDAKFGIGGVITFKNEINLKEFIKKVDLNDIVLETDSPYLSPEPKRGKINKPSNVYYVAEKIAEITNKNKEEIVKLTTKNALSQFDLNI
jgi:TatD DNase family protein